MSSSATAKSASRIQRITEARCREWAAKPTVNPITGKPIEIDGPTYNALKDRCLNKYNIVLPEAVSGILSHGNSPDPNANNALSSSAATSSASVETKNLTAGWKCAVPKTETAAMKIIEKIGDQISRGIKTLVTAQNADPVDGLKKVNISKLFKNLPYYRPYIDSINNEEIFDSSHENVRMDRIRRLIEKRAFHQYRLGFYTRERLVRLVDSSAPKVLVMLHKVCTFINALYVNMIPNAPRYNQNEYATAIINAIRPHLAEAQRKVDNMNIGLIMRRASQATETPGAHELAANVAALMLTRQPTGGKHK